MKSSAVGKEGLDEFLKNAQASSNIKLTSDEREVVEYKKKTHHLRTHKTALRICFFIVKGKVKNF
jgi:hypothetical protein